MIADASKAWDVGRTIAALLVLMVLGGCALTHARAEHEQARLAAVHAAAGAPVNTFRYDAVSMYAWEALDANELLIYTQPREAWLLDVGYCPNLPYTSFIGITSHVGVVSRNLDRVVLDGGPAACHIQKIRPVDVSQLRQQMHPRDGATMVPESKAARR